MGRMYGLDPTTDLSAMSGGTLTFVGLGEHQAQLHFSGEPDCSVSIEGDYCVAAPGDSPVTFNGTPAGAAALAALLGNTVALAEVADGGTLRLIFTDSAVVEALDSESQYESYQLTLGDRLIVV